MRKEEPRIMSLLTVSHLSAGYGRKEILHDINFTSRPGTITGILGANGCGKTTLLKAIANILPHKGSCLLAENTLESLSTRELAKQCGYIPQKSGITIDMTVLDVVLMGYHPDLSLLQPPTAQMKEHAKATLTMIGLPDREQENYNQLSEGQKQLCILARAFVGTRKLLLLDEPESALDFRFRNQMMQHLRTYVTAHDACALVTLHDPSLALNTCDELLVLSKGTRSGKISPKLTPVSKMESLLSSIYGTINIAKLHDKNGNEHLVMIQEESI